MVSFSITQFSDESVPVGYMKYFGFYRPWGFKKNIYMVFYTTNPQQHFNVIETQYLKLENEGFFDTDNISPNNRSQLIYSNKNFSNTDLYNKLIEQLKDDGNHINSQNIDSNIKSWSFVKLTDRNFENKNYFENILNKFNE